MTLSVTLLALRNHAEAVLKAAGFTNEELKQILISAEKGERLQVPQDFTVLQERVRDRGIVTDLTSPAMRNTSDRRNTGNSVRDFLDRPRKASAAGLRYRGQIRRASKLTRVKHVSPEIRAYITFWYTSKGWDPKRISAELRDQFNRSLTPSRVKQVIAKEALRRRA